MTYVYQYTRSTECDVPFFCRFDAVNRKEEKEYNTISHTTFP